jgi:hypothetical protein
MIDYVVEFAIPGLIASMECLLLFLVIKFM